MDGVLLTKAAVGFRPPWRQMIKEANIPFVLVMRTYPRLTKDAVITDDYQRACDAVCHPAHVGRRRIGLISGPLKISNAMARWQGFHDAIKAQGLLFEPRLVIECDYRIESGFRAGHALLSHPDRVYVANHLMTIGLLKAAEEMGPSCPDDFGLVSFDDYPWLGVFRPRLSTVELRKHQLRSEAAELLIERIAGSRRKAVVRKLQPQLNISESCGFGLHGSRGQASESLSRPAPGQTEPAGEYTVGIRPKPYAMAVLATMSTQRCHSMPLRKNLRSKNLSLHAPSKGLALQEHRNGSDQQGRCRNRSGPKTQELALIVALYARSRVLSP